MSTQYGFFQLLDTFYHRLQGPIFQKEIPLVVSICYYAFTMLLARVLRLVNSRCVSKKYQVYTGDLITGFQICACSLENSMLRRYYGWTGYASVLFVLGVWYALTIHDSRGNPCGNMVDYLQGKATFKKSLLRTVVQLIGGLLSYRYARNFWRLGLRHDDTERFKLLHCSGSLTVSPYNGLFIEFVGSFIDSLLAVTTMTPFFASEVTTKVSIGVLLTCLGVDRTGMYLNPVNASNQEFGCGNIPHLVHVLIYWVGPLLAAALAVFLKQQVDVFIQSLRKEELYPGSTFVNEYSHSSENGIGNGHQIVHSSTSNGVPSQSEFRYRTNGVVPSLDVNHDIYGRTTKRRKKYFRK